MIVYGSRGSDLALTQTRWVAERVKAETGEDYRIEVMVTTGDKIQDRPLAGIGVKGLFTKELEDALRDGSISFSSVSIGEKGRRMRRAEVSHGSATRDVARRGHTRRARYPVTCPRTACALACVLAACGISQPCG